MPSSSHRKTMLTRNLHKFEMKELVNVLRDASPPRSDLHTSNEAIKKKIKDLPRRLRISKLRSSHLSGSRGLCTTHKGLNVHLIHNVWSWIKHEINSSIGKFIYPIVISGGLTCEQEVSVRQLEPVLKMWRKSFRTATSAPPGREPMECGSKWSYQHDLCPACMLTRIGSDEGTLFALFAGMVGHFNIHKLVHGNHNLNDLKVSHLDNRLKSKRARFVRYWIKASRSGGTLLYKAGELGIQLKKLNESLKKGKILSTSSNIYGLDGTAPRQPNGSPSDPFRDPAEEMERLHISETTIKNSAHDAKLGPLPRPTNVNQYSPLGGLGFDSSTSGDSAPTNNSDSMSSLDTDNTSLSDCASTIGPDESISVISPLNITKKTEYKDHACKPPASTASFTTIQSYNGGSSRDAGGFVHDPLATPSEVLNKYKALLDPHLREGKNAMYSLPMPQQESMYFGFADDKVAQDPFEDVDEEGGEDEVVDFGDDDEVGASCEELY